MGDSPLSPLEDAVRAFIDWVEEAEIPHLIIGAIASSLLGRPRATRDVDAVIWAESEEIDALLEGASAHGLVARVKDASEFARHSRVLLLVHEASRIDLDVALGLLPFEKQAIDQPHWGRLGEIEIPIPQPEDLIVMKAVANRPRDAADIEAVLAARPRLDRERVRRLVREFSEALADSTMLDRLEELFRRVPSS